VPFVRPYRWKFLRPLVPFAHKWLVSPGSWDTRVCRSWRRRGFRVCGHFAVAGSSQPRTRDRVKPAQWSTVTHLVATVERAVPTGDWAQRRPRSAAELMMSAQSGAAVPDVWWLEVSRKIRASPEWSSKLGLGHLTRPLEAPGTSATPLDQEWC